MDMIPKDKVEKSCDVVIDIVLHHARLPHLTETERMTLSHLYALATMLGLDGPAGTVRKIFQEAVDAGRQGGGDASGQG